MALLILSALAWIGRGFVSEAVPRPELKPEQQGQELGQGLKQDGTLGIGIGAGNGAGTEIGTGNGNGTATATATATGIGNGIGAGNGTGTGVDLSWYPPRNTAVNNLTSALFGVGVYGIVFDSGSFGGGGEGEGGGDSGGNGKGDSGGGGDGDSGGNGDGKGNGEGQGEGKGDGYGDEINWCDMPRVRRDHYVTAPEGFSLVYVEVIQRHHKRTPYASNGFPVEEYHWNCDDEGLYTYGEPFQTTAEKPGRGFWTGYISPVNPFVPSGWVGTCQFPQLTAPGLLDSYAHGQDLYSVYHDLLGFLPSRDENWRDSVVYRVTQNVITSQVAGMLIGGMWETTESIPLLIEAAGVDSLEPQYSCEVGSALFGSIESSSDARWQAHLDSAAGIYVALDSISGVPASDAGFHASFDHYYDNLSARQCHGKPLPCKIVDGLASDICVNQTLADAVYRLGQWEYSHIYRDSPLSLSASVASYGVWIAELAAHLRAVMAGEETRLYFHNVAHDGSISRLLSVLQVDVMIWPGMGSEVIFELYKRAPSLTQRTLDRSGYYVRVLYGGRTLRSSNPSLGVVDMLPVETLLAYFDGLVGRDASLVMGKCNGTIET